MKQIVHYGMVLMAIGMIAGAGLWAVDKATRPKITAAARAALKSGQAQAFPGAARFGDAKTFTHEGKKVTYYEVYGDGDELRGYEVLYTVQGYQSQIKVLTGVSTNWVITGITVLHQAETPGLGAEMDAVPTSRTLWQALAGIFGGASDAVAGGPRIPPFQAQFRGKTIEELVVVKHPTEKNIEAMTGSTISSRAVTRCVREPVTALRAYLAEREET